MKHIVVKGKTFCSLVTYLFIVGIFFWLRLPVASIAGGLEVQDNYIEPDFPNGVTFHLSVSGRAVIDSIELAYGTNQITCGFSSAKARPDFEPATQVNTSWTWNFRKSGAPPPGARLWGRWIIRDESGNELAVAEQELFLEDPRYEWQEIRSDELVLFSAVPNEAVNQALWQAANKALERLENDVGPRPVGLVKIYNYPTTQDLRDAVVYTRDWTGGMALSAYETILLGVNQHNLEWGERVIAHELAHIVIHQLTFNCLGDLPRWLNEGLATYIEGDLDDYLQASLDQAVTDDALLSLRSLGSSFPTSSKRADLAYAQSRQVVGYLIEIYGSEKMAALLQAFKVGNTYDQALQQVYGLDTQGLDNEWRRSLGLSLRQIIATSTPMSLPTLELYGASTPTAGATSTLTSTPTPTTTPVPTATPTVIQTATPLPQPTTTPLPTSTFTSVTPASDGGTSPLVLILGATVIIGILSTIVIWVRRIR
jgi:hypothetical protein